MQIGAEGDRSSDLSAHLCALEERLLRPEVRSSPEALRTLLTEEFREFGSSGRVFTRDEIIRELGSDRKLPGCQWRLSDFCLERVGLDVALVTYRAHRTMAGVDVESLRSSLWRYRDGRCQMVFHQGTIVSGP